MTPKEEFLQKHNKQVREQLERISPNNAGAASRPEKIDQPGPRQNKTNGEDHRAVANEAPGEAEQPIEFTSPSDGTAFAYSWHWRAHGEAEITDSRPHLVQDVIPEVGAGLMSGQWGTFKTFVALDLSGSVMSETPFINFPVRRRSGVLFFACEGEAEVVIRLQAVVEAKCGPGRAPFLWVEGCPRLLDPNATKILAAMVKQAADRILAEFGLPVGLIIVDTAGDAAGYIKAGDENDAVLARAVMKALATLAKEARAFVLGIEHFGKAVETGTRGSSAKEASADVVLALLGDKSISGAVVDTRTRHPQATWRTERHRISVPHQGGRHGLRCVRLPDHDLDHRLVRVRGRADRQEPGRRLGEVAQAPAPDDDECPGRSWDRSTTIS